MFSQFWIFYFRFLRSFIYQPAKIVDVDLALPLKRLGGKRGAGVPGYGVPGSLGHGKRGPGVWKTRGVENAGSGGKHGVSVENTGSKCKT